MILLNYIRFFATMSNLTLNLDALHAASRHSGRQLALR